MLDKKSCLIVIVMVLLVLPAGAAAEKGMSRLGVYAGWAFGEGADRDWNWDPRHVDTYRPLHHLGIYFQRDLSADFGLQVNASFQWVKYDSRSWGWPGSEVQSESGKRALVGLDLLAVLQTPRSKYLQFFFQGGGGIGSGTLYAVSGFHFGVTAGAGLRLFLKPGSNSALFCGGSFRFLLAPEKSGADTANYFRVSVGYEFAARAPND